MTSVGQNKHNEHEKQSPNVTMEHFLESCPPNQEVLVSNLFKAEAGNRTVLYRPDLSIYCHTDFCSGIRFFAEYRISQEYPREDGFLYAIIEYICRNCRRSTKVFAIRAFRKEAVAAGKMLEGRALKIGEVPPFGPHTPSRVITLIGPDREIFLKGRRAENQGLGIGAFAYYRRVVEDQKSRLLENIAQVARRLNASEEVIATLETAQGENQFSKALEQIKDAVPQALLINGHNPLALLHAALSKGLHADTDEQCLEIAKNIRVVLVELSERINQILKDQSELDRAVSMLMRERD